MTAKIYNYHAGTQPYDAQAELNRLFGLYLDADKIATHHSWDNEEANEAADKAYAIYSAYFNEVRAIEAAARQAEANDLAQTQSDMSRGGW